MSVPCDNTNLSRFIFSHGSREGDLEELLSNAALFVLPSSVEGMSLALLDAMAAGVCVLTSDIPENQEVVENAGFTFHRGDRADLERMLGLLISSPELRRQSADRGRECVQQEYRWPEIARSIEKAYYDVLGWNSTESMSKRAVGELIQIRHAAISTPQAGQRASVAAKSPMTTGTYEIRH
jgi:glycosyltransferase involved in cell wall biosynthesis